MKKISTRSILIFFFPYLGTAVFTTGVVVILALPIMVVREAGEANLLKFKAYIDVLVPYIPVFMELLILLAVICFILAFLTFYFFSYELTENAFKTARGIIFRKYVTIPYKRIQNIDICQGPLERALYLSSIFVQTANFSGDIERTWKTDGYLPGLSKKKALELQEELVRRTKSEK